jgi:protein gp37
MKNPIGWCDYTINPIVGCSHVSAECDNCYASRMAHVRSNNPLTPQYKGLTHKVNGQIRWIGETRWVGGMERVLRWKKPLRIFVGSMCDLFHESVPFEWLDKIFHMISSSCSQHTFMLLTKRPERMRDYISSLNFMPPNVWLGVTSGTQEAANERIPILLQTPAAKRFVSIEPMLGFIDLETAWHGENALDSECWGECRWCANGHPPLHNCQKNKQSELEFDRGRSGLDWVICGGENGPNARSMHPDWVRGLRDQCQTDGVPFWFKGWGEFLPDSQNPAMTGVDAHCSGGIRVGRKKSGCLLDGREWKEGAR